MVPEAARTYTSLLSEIRNTEKEISSPEYENQIQEYHKLRSHIRVSMDEQQKEKEELLQKAARGRQVLNSNQFSDQASINACQAKAQENYDEYMEARAACNKKTKKDLFCPFPGHRHLAVMRHGSTLLSGRSKLFHRLLWT